MEPPEGTIHSFIVKIWLQSPGTETATATWSGQITHVPDGARRSLRTIDDITAFIAPYLLAMHVTLGFRWRMRLWLSRWK
jgi:hypothetical protein